MAYVHEALPQDAPRSARLAPVLVLAAALCFGATTEQAQARGGASSPGVANKYEGVKVVSWNGLELHVFSVPSMGLLAYKVVAPEKAATGWRRCEESHGEQTSLEQCVGALGR